MTARVKHPPPALFLVGLVLLSGCIFSPDRKKAVPPPPLPEYLEPISPQNVLQNLIASYVARDSIETKVVYDIDYKGTSSDPSQPTPLPEFTRAIEVSHVHRLKVDPNIVSVLLDLGAPGTWQLLDGNSSDPLGSKIIQINSQTVRIEDITVTTYVSTNQVMEYAFKPTAVPGAPADRDTTWQVIRWKEL